MTRTQPLTIAFLAFDRFQLLDITGPLQTFASASELNGAAAYRPIIVSRSGGLVASSSGVRLDTLSFKQAAQLRIDTLIVPGGPGVHDAARDHRMIAWVQRRATAARRAGSVCTGAFLVAATGLLDGRPVTTHWRECDRLARRFPQVRLYADAIFVREGKVFTAAGVTAGIDLALALVEEDLGRALAMRVARHLVPRHRDYDGLPLSQSRIGKSCGGTRTSMLRAMPGWRRINPARSRVSTIWWIEGGVTWKWRCMSASAGA